MADALASPADGKRSAVAVVIDGVVHPDPIDGDGAIGVADGLVREREEALQHGGALGQVMALVEEARDLVGRAHDHQLGHV